MQATTSFAGSRDEIARGGQNILPVLVQRLLKTFPDAVPRGGTHGPAGVDAIPPTVLVFAHGRVAQTYAKDCRTTGKQTRAPAVWQVGLESLRQDFFRFRTFRTASVMLPALSPYSSRSCVGVPLSPKLSLTATISRGAG